MEIIAESLPSGNLIEEHRNFDETELNYYDEDLPLESEISYDDNETKLILLKLALNDLITPIIAILPAKQSRPMQRHKDSVYESSEDILSQAVYLYHHFKLVTAREKQSCDIDLACIDDNFSSHCLNIWIIRNGDYNLLDVFRSVF